MRRIAGGILLVLNAALLLLCLSTAALWARSYTSRGVATLWVHDGCSYWIEFPRGEVEWVREVNSFPSAKMGFEMAYPCNSLPPRTWGGFGAVHAAVPLWSARDRAVRTVGISAFTMPSWLAVLALGALPAMSGVRRARRGQRATPGRCARCAYDLTGNLSGVCPECGSPLTSRRIG